MNVLIIGGGGREHALAWKAAQSPRVETVFVAPGNAGTAIEPRVRNVAIASDDIPALVDFAVAHEIALTIVGPEAPLVLGVVDAFAQAGLRCFGPGREAAQLEGSKAFCKDFLRRHHIPTAAYGTFAELDPALSYVRDVGVPIVIKADGLAAGKGVVIARTQAEAEKALTEMLSGDAFGNAGRRVVIEEFLSGEEASFIVMSDGRHILPMATSQDHKPRDDGDTGPNTGGMGAYSPAPVVTDSVYETVMREVIRPTIEGMERDGHPYVGFLYAGLMIDPQGRCKVLEYNCRFGDPETQPIMLRLRSDLVDLCERAIDRRLEQTEVHWDPRASLGVVMAAGGYPGHYENGKTIEGLSEAVMPDCKVFHAGTAQREGRVVTAGGRVLCACALGDSVAQAQRKAYEVVGRIHWEGVYYRKDIGYRAIQRELSAR